MPFIVIIGLIFIIIKTFLLLINKEFMERHNKDGMMSGYIILALIVEIVALSWMIKFYFL